MQRRILAAMVMMLATACAAGEGDEQRPGGAAPAGGIEGEVEVEVEVEVEGSTGSDSTGPSSTSGDSTGAALDTGDTSTGGGLGEETTGEASTGDASTGDSTGDPVPDPVPVAVCGDGQVDAGEECDDGPANDDDGACTMVCVLATCGDGLVHKGVEACDDANGNDIDGCTAACANGPQQLGKYDVSSGPKWQDDPAPVSCKEACAQLHGGGPEEYACSTVEGEINGKAYLNGYEDQTYCASPADDDFKAGENYNCGKAGCAFSARVNDSCWNSYNVCWKL